MPTHLKPGDRAPDFSAQTGEGSKLSLSDLKGKKNLALFFYVRDNTPGCTREARAFRDAIAEFEGKNTAVVGVSTNGAESHQRFATNNELEFPLLADTDASIAKAFGVLKSSGRMAERATFLIDKEGVVRAVWPKVSITGHTREILGTIEELGLA
jgi:peroxiredoxin Q/BCP